MCEIDLVYTWVDDTDEEWQKKKKLYLDSETNYNSDAIDSCRFCNNDELKYSLRSVEQNADWIRRIYVITDNQIPKWLNLENPKIRIVDHKEIIPNEKLPIFNSCAIETRIPYIEDLSEYFLYANDDTFFWNHVEKEFFFENGKPICRTDKFLVKNKIYKHLYGSTIQNAYNLVKNKYKIRFNGFFPHHNIDAYRKSLFFECIEEFQEEFDRTLDNRFRDFSDIQRTIVEFYSIAVGKAELKPTILNPWQKLAGVQPDSMLYQLNKISDKVLKSKAKLVCFNDSRKISDEKRVKIKDILAKKFPDKSQFEV